MCARVRVSRITARVHAHGSLWRCISPHRVGKSLLREAGMRVDQPTSIGVFNEGNDSRGSVPSRVKRPR